jgi:hypothetical protein
MADPTSLEGVPLTSGNPVVKHPRGLRLSDTTIA